MIVEYSTENLVDRRQIGWIKYREGNALINCKVVRSKDGRPFLSHVNGYMAGVSVECVQYEDKDHWAALGKVMLAKFKERVGSDYYHNFLPKL